MLVVQKNDKTIITEWMLNDLLVVVVDLNDLLAE
jgi:hypothetical protein